VSRIAGINHKEGKSGSLVFVLVRHELSDERGVAVIEENDIVYREPPAPGSPPPKPKTSTEPYAWSREIVANEVMLFRYSALSFNAHRIHYDHPYATRVEGYPGLVVHGVLVATLLADLVRRNLPNATLGHFAFRAVGPLFAGASFRVCGKPREASKEISLWAVNSNGELAMDASATIA
jgi:3-methylfumaryl-CoA hydratase